MSLANLLAIDPTERVTAMVAIENFSPGFFLLMATRLGEVKKTAIAEFASVRSNGLIAMDLEEGDELVAAGLGADESEVILASGKGQTIRFASRDLRSASRTSGGVRGMRLAPGDQVNLDLV